MTPDKNFIDYIYKTYSSDFRNNLRWRINCNPYYVFVSEIMLQQTQVERVRKYFDVWVERFPTFKDVAESSREEVLMYWQGLGYNRRAINLHETCKLITYDFNEKMPRDKKIISSFPGIGSYTSAAISVFAYNQPDVLIETNIRTVFIKYFFFDYENRISDKELYPLIQKTIDLENPRVWFYTLMDAGSKIKKEEKNYNNLSCSYAKQSKFVGSSREARSNLLKLILKNKQIMYEDAISFLNRIDSIQIINSLLKDNIIILKNNMLFVEK